MPTDDTDAKRERGRETSIALGQSSEQAMRSVDAAAQRAGIWSLS